MLSKNLVKVTMLIFFAMLAIAYPTFASVAPTAGSIEQAQAMIEKDADLRNEVGKERKFFIEKIVSKGSSKITEKEFRTITAPFESNWLTKKDVERIIQSLKAVYIRKGLDPARLRITCQIKKPKTLEISLVQAL